MRAATQEKLAALWASDYSVVRDSLMNQGASFEAAEDITMSALVEIGNGLEKGTTKPDGALLQTIAAHRLIDLKRSAGEKLAAAGKLVALDEHDDPLDSFGYRPYYDPDFSVGFDSALRRLPKAERDVFILTAIRGVTQREAAEILGLTKTDVDRRAKSARTLIREELAA